MGPLGAEGKHMTEMGRATLAGRRILLVIGGGIAAY